MKAVVWSMMKRFLSFILGAALIAVLAVPVSADEGNPGGWIELLEYSSVQSNGENWFTLNGQSGGFTVPLYGEKRLCKVDMLIWHQYAERITSASVTSGNTTQRLTILHVGDGLSRVYGAIPNAYYEFLNVSLSHSSTSQVTFELLSCRVTPVQTTDMSAHGTIWPDDNASSPISAPGSFVTEGTAVDLTLPWQTPILINDWQKFDTVTVYGSLSGIGLNSVRCSIGSKGLPYEITYTSTNPTGTGESYTETVSITHYDTTDRYYGDIYGTHDTSYAYLGKVLYTITIDLSGIDRTVTHPLVVYFTGVTYDLYSHAFNCQDLSGSIITPDTSGVTWWNRFTSFMTDLFGADQSSDALDDLGSSSDSISQNTSQIHDFEQSQQAVLDNNFAQIQGAISFTNFAAALVFVQKYTNMTFNGISKYAIVFTLPLFLGLFFYLCSRIPGITRWKTPPPRSPSPKSKGGGKT